MYRTPPPILLNFASFPGLSGNMKDEGRDEGNAERSKVKQPSFKGVLKRRPST